MARGGIKEASSTANSNGHTKEASNSKKAASDPGTNRGSPSITITRSGRLAGTNRPGDSSISRRPTNPLLRRNAEDSDDDSESSQESDDESMDEDVMLEDAPLVQPARQMDGLSMFIGQIPPGSAMSAQNRPWGQPQQHHQPHHQHQQQPQLQQLNVFGKPPACHQPARLPGQNLGDHGAQQAADHGPWMEEHCAIRAAATAEWDHSQHSRLEEQQAALYALYHKGEQLAAAIQRADWVRQQRELELEELRKQQQQQQY
ncbi:hypothetical protein C8A05DRAFT_39886, partial [Staphylotrichum tortipilum]